MTTSGPASPPRWGVKAKRLCVYMGLIAAVGWIVLAAVYAGRRYGCNPTEAQCLIGFWRRFEDFILLQWLDAWQTLVSGAFALAAALIGAAYLSRQISLADRHEQDRIARGHAAARAALSFNLDRLWRYEENVVAWLKTQLASIPAGALTGPPPELEDAVVSALERMIAHSVKGEISPYAELMSLLQVQQARNHGIWVRWQAGDLPNRFELLDRCYDAIEAAARVNALFPYARFDSNAPAPRSADREDITNARRTIGFRDHEVTRHDGADISARIDRRWPNHGPPQS